MISLFSQHGARDKVANVTIGILYNYRVDIFQICYS